MLISVAGKSTRDKTIAGHVDAIVEAKTRIPMLQLDIDNIERYLQHTKDRLAIAKYKRKLNDYKYELRQASDDVHNAGLGLARAGLSKKEVQELLDAAVKRRDNHYEKIQARRASTPAGAKPAGQVLLGTFGRPDREQRTPKKEGAKPAVTPKRTSQKDTKPAGKLKRTPQLLAAAVKASPAIHAKIKKIDTDLKTLRKELILAYRKRLKDKGKK